MTAIKCLLALIAVFAASAKVFAAPYGAAVSWVGYDNRGDFLHDEFLLDRIIEGSQSDATRGFFGIPSIRHLKVPVNGTLYSYDSRPSFRSSTIDAVATLIERTQKDPTVEPYLVVAIASHGNKGIMGRQYGGNVYLDDLANVVMEQVEFFYRETRRKLRIEVLYSACHSGSMISSFQKKMDEFKRSGRPVGPVSILTTTSEDVLAYANPLSGDPLLRMVLELGSGIYEMKQSVPWKARAPTLGQFGFFRDFGPGTMNHPQIFTTDFPWTALNSIDFLNTSAYKLLFGKGLSLYHRDLKLDLAMIIQSTSTVPEAIDVLKNETWNGKLEADPGIIGKYFASPKKNVRYGAALFVLDRLNKPISSQQGSFEQFRSVAEELASQWVVDPELSTLDGTDIDKKITYMNYFEYLPVSGNKYEAILNGIEKIYDSDPNPNVARAALDKVREVLTLHFRVRPSRDYKYSGVSLRAVPEKIKRMLIKYHFVLPPDIAKGDVFSHLAHLAPKGKIRIPSLQYCDMGLLVKDPQMQLEKLSSHVVGQYDSGTYIGASW